MHKAALVDTSLRSGNKTLSKKFKWLVSITTVIEESDSEAVFKMKRPAKFSETKFADHSHEVYDKFRNNYKAFILTLEQAIDHGINGSSDQKKKKILLQKSMEGFIIGIL